MLASQPEMSPRVAAPNFTQPVMAEAAAPAFRIRGLRRRFGSTPKPVEALRGVDLDVPQGGFMVVVGPSGCGKTTLLRILAGFERPDAGEVWLDDRKLAGPAVFVRPERRQIGIVTQEGSLFPHLSVAANIAYGLPGLRWRAAGRRARRTRVDELLEWVGLTGYAARMPDALSGGEQQRVALARALAPRPRAVLLDEPFSALDARLRVGLREDVRRLLAELGTTAVLVTHDQSEALSLADRLALMRAGRVVQEGSPTEVYARPADPEAAAFLGEATSLPCRLLAEHDGGWCISCALGNSWVPAACVHSGGSENRLVLRPEQLELATLGAPAQVNAVRYFGHETLLQLALEDGTPILLRLRDEQPPALGDRVRLRLREQRAMCALPNPRTLPAPAIPPTQTSFGDPVR